MSHKKSPIINLGSMVNPYLPEVAKQLVSNVAYYVSDAMYEDIQILSYGFKKDRITGEHIEAVATYQVQEDHGLENFQVQLRLHKMQEDRPWYAYIIVYRVENSPIGGTCRFVDITPDVRFNVI